MTRFDLLAGCAAALGLMAVSPARGQDLQAPSDTPGAGAEVSAPPLSDPTSDDVQFSADTLEYDFNADIVIAKGEVRMSRQGQRLRAAQVEWNRNTGRVVATGNIAITDAKGDVAYGDSIELTDSLKDGVVDNMLVVLDRGGRLAADKGTRDPNGVISLDRAAYSPCPVTTTDGCPKEPTWKITAVRITYQPDRKRVYYDGARFHLFGLPTVPLPRFSHPVGEGSESGLLTPGLRLDRVNGLEITTPYYFGFGPNRGLTITPHLFSNVLPMLQAQYQALDTTGAYSITGYATSSRRSDDLSSGFASTTERAFRGYLDGVGRFQIDPNWSVSGSLRLVTDRTFLRRYDISRDDRLRTTLAVERIDRDSYFAIRGWAVQTLRVNDRQGLQPVALPEIDFRKRITDPWIGGVAQFQLNTLAIGRASGQDTQRAFASARWDLRRLTTLGQEVTLTAFGRLDAYNTNASLTTPALYRGDDGFQTRGIGTLAAEIRWPFVGEMLGGIQRFTPRLQVVASPRVRNIELPNEDARAVDLEDSNLFSLNRFPGYDRWEDSSRVTYGGQYQLDLPGFTIDAVVGQSYRLDNRETILPDGTGLGDRFSDIVGRTEVRYADLVSLNHRYRLDKDSLAIRRNEVDATIGTRSTYALLGYLRLDRNIVGLEDLQDREEVRVAGRVQFARFWSAFGSAVVDLTDRREDVFSVADGFDPLRHRLGVSYEDDCLNLGVTWRRDYRDTGDARRGNSFLLTLAFKNLGR